MPTPTNSGEVADDSVVADAVVDDAVVDDATVIDKSQTDPAAFAQLYRRHSPVIERYITRRLGPDVAEDLTAETFLIAFRKRNTYDLRRSSALPWLYGIATNLVGRHRRSEVIALRALARTGIDPVTEPFSDHSDSRVSADAVARRLAAALAALPTQHRHALLLVTWAQLSYEETALAIGAPIGTVRSRVSRARERLRRALGGVDPTSIMEERLS